jgi:hypothetical protein
MDGGGTTSHHVIFRALHIDLDECDIEMGWDQVVQAIDPDHDLLELRVRSVVDALIQAAIGGVVFDVLERDLAGVIAQSTIMDVNLREAPAQGIGQIRDGLEREEMSLRGQRDPLAEKIPLVGADIKTNRISGQTRMALGLERFTNGLHTRRIAVGGDYFGGDRHAPLFDRPS